VYTTLVAFHVLAAAVWIGGTVSLVFTAVPVLRQLEPRERAALIRSLGRRWRPIGWTALGILGASGIWLAFGYWGADSSSTLFHTSTGHELIAKAVLYVVLVMSTILHDLVLGPRLNRQIREGLPRTLRRPMQIVGWISFAATLALPVLGVLVTT
jgi:putative copper resistance protein D